MIFSVFGGFEIKKAELKKELRESVWGKTEQSEAGLSKACGCYIFALKIGKSITPWYVGKAEKQSFAVECAQPHKLQIVRSLISEHRGSLRLYLVARRMRVRGSFSKPTTARFRDIEFLESMLIGLALKRNPNLLNIQKTTLLRDMSVPGVINSPRRAPTDAEIELRNVLRLS